MGFDALSPVLDPEWTTSFWWKVSAPIVFILAIICLWSQGRILSREDRENREAKDRSAKNFEAITARLSNSNISLETKDNGLRGKVLALGHDLFAFLREKGPRPTVQYKESMTLFEKIRAAMEANGPYVEAIHYGYQHRFRQRVVDLFDELAEHGISDPEIKSWDIDPPQIQNGDRIRKIAESLLLLATKMQIADAPNAS